jgi:glycosyltransferase involved in cell wall biosynthesis
VAVLARCEEFIRPLDGVARVVDQYDCATLALERDIAAHPRADLRSRVRRWERLRTHRHNESQLGRDCDLVTAISPSDVQRLRDLVGDDCPVVLAPNGVDDAPLARPPAAASARRAVAFWGNLSFDVNRLAIKWFYRQVWLPCLEPAGIRWSIVGGNADAEIEAMARRHPDIELPGYVANLFDHVADYPIMVNPMQNGAGLKNKVLEAMAIGATVVTTGLGVDALPFEPGVHGVVVDEPAAFGQAIVELLDDDRRRLALADRARALVRSDYTWQIMGRRYADLLEAYGPSQVG